MKIRNIEIELHQAGEALSDHIRRENDFYEAEILDYIALNFPVHQVILDIGANIGNHSLYFANFLKYHKIVAYEPIPRNYYLLIQNLARYKNVEISTFALSDREEKVPMFEFPPNMGASGYNKDGPLMVSGYPLDAFHHKDVTFMKIDVENFEEQVLAGAKETINRNKPLILIEDGYNKYAELLPQYECIASWSGYKTFLYRWKE